MSQSRRESRERKGARGREHQFKNCCSLPGSPPGLGRGAGTKRPQNLPKRLATGCLVPHSQRLPSARLGRALPVTPPQEQNRSEQEPGMMCGLSSTQLQGTLLSPSMVASNPVGTQVHWWLAQRALFSGAEMGMLWPAPCSPGCSVAVECTAGESTWWFYTTGVAQAGMRIPAVPMGGGDAEA